MAKILSETERKLQKKLIPVNLFVCIICLVAVFSLVAMPLLKVDIGKILKSESMISFVEKQVNKTIADNTEEGSVDYAPTVATIVSEVLGTAQGAFSISGLDAAKVMLKKGENAPKKVTDAIFNAEDGVFNVLIDRVANEVSALFGNAEGLNETLRTQLSSSVDGITKHSVDYLAKNNYVVYAVLAFAAPWLILFLFSFFHMMAKNKRFSMWYVKLTGFIPALVFFVVPKLAPVLLGKFAAKLPADITALVKAAISGISSYAWISGVCYVVLWLVSIFWAFPIKRKIRKERKACKKAMKKGTYQPAAGYGNSAPAYGDSYDGAYGGYGDSYGSSYDDGYGVDYGGFNDTYDGDLDELSSYGYGDDYDSYGSSYDDDYGSYRSPFDDDDDY